MKNLKFFDVLPILAFIFCFSVFAYTNDSKITKKVVKTEVQRVYEGDQTFVRHITHYEQDSSSCVPVRPECDLYRMQKMTYKQYLLDSSALILGDYYFAQFFDSRDNFYKKEYLKTYFKEKFWTQYFDFKETRLVLSHDTFYLKNKIVTESGFSYVYLFPFFFIFFYAFRLFYVLYTDKEQKAQSLVLLFFVLFLGAIIFFHSHSDTELNYLLPILFLFLCAILILIDMWDYKDNDTLQDFKKLKKTLAIFISVVMLVILLNFLTFKDYHKMIITLVFSVFALLVPSLYQVFVDQRKIKNIKQIG